MNIIKKEKETTDPHKYYKTYFNESDMSVTKFILNISLPIGMTLSEFCDEKNIDVRFLYFLLYEYPNVFFNLICKINYDSDNVMVYYKWEYEKLKKEYELKAPIYTNHLYEDVELNLMNTEIKQNNMNIEKEIVTDEALNKTKEIVLKESITAEQNHSTLLGMCENNIRNNKTTNNTNTTDNNTQYEYVNHPSHYNNYSMEVIDMMRKIYGDENTALFCEMNAFKYRMRMGTKPDNSIQQDLKKEKWYLNKANEIKSQIPQ